MSTVLTLVASDKTKPVDKIAIDGVIDILGTYKIMPTCEPVWLEPDMAADIGITESGDRKLIAHLHQYLESKKIDVFINPIENRRKKLLIADMDSTIVSGETLDDLAEHAGLKDKISEITTRAMNGELDFHEAITERVALLKGLEVSAIKDTLNKLETNQGAHTLIKTLRENGVICVLVSGGFTVFTEPVAKSLGFNNHHGNVLEIERDALTGKVQHPIQDKDSKVQYLRFYAERHNLKEADCMGIGDGANDLPMLQRAGLGIGYKPKETVAQKINNVILYGDLTAALYAQGYVSTEFYRVKERKS
jgi:phosphoserine phosphatase